MFTLRDKITVVHHHTTVALKQKYGICDIEDGISEISPHQF